MAKKTIWVLTSVAAIYDQPPNNLEAWWSEKPTLLQVAKVIYPDADNPGPLLGGLIDLMNEGTLHIPHWGSYSLFQWEEED